MLLREHELQEERYEFFRRSNLKDASVRKVISAVTNLTVPKNTLIGVKGAAKIFVGELIEEARTVMTERNESGPLRPWHVREAFERLEEQGKTPPVNPVIPKGFTAKRNLI